jgi:hypothetical protein
MGNAPIDISVAEDRFLYGLDPSGGTMDTHERAGKPIKACSPSTPKAHFSKYRNHFE